MKSRILQITLAILLLLLAPIGLCAQSEAEAGSLIIENQQGEQALSLQPGDRLNYKTKGGELQRKGKIESVQDSSVTVAGQEVAFSNLEMVQYVKGHKHPRGSRLLRHSALGMLISALLFLLTVAMFRGNSNSDQRGLILVFALLAFLIFPLLLILALIMVAGSKKKFSLTDGWRLRKG